MDVGENNPTNGRIHDTDITKTPNDLFIHNDLLNILETLMNVIFPNLFPGTIENNSAILTPKNCDRDVINSIVRRNTNNTPIQCRYSKE